MSETEKLSRMDPTGCDSGTLIEYSDCEKIGGLSLASRTFTAISTVAVMTGEPLSDAITVMVVFCDTS